MDMFAHSDWILFFSFFFKQSTFKLLNAQNSNFEQVHVHQVGLDAA